MTEKRTMSQSGTETEKGVEGEQAYIQPKGERDGEKRRLYELAAEEKEI